MEEEKQGGSQEEQEEIKEKEKKEAKPTESKEKKCCAKNPMFLIVAIIVLIIIGLLIFGGDREMGDVETEAETEAEEEISTIGESEPLDMQGFYLYVPQGHHCEGGFTDGYRYLDAECHHEDRDDYEIEVQRGFTVTTVNPEEGLVPHQISVRSFNLTGERDLHVCEEYSSKDLRLDAEHYVCFHKREDKDVIIMGFGKTFLHDDGAYARWTEAEIRIQDEEAEYTEEEYIETLARFLNVSIDVDWSEYAPE